MDFLKLTIIKKIIMKETIKYLITGILAFIWGYYQISIFPQHIYGEYFYVITAFTGGAYIGVYIPRFFNYLIK